MHNVQINSKRTPELNTCFGHDVIWWNRRVSCPLHRCSSAAHVVFVRHLSGHGREKDAFLQFSGFSEFYWEGLETYLPLLYGNLTSDLNVDMSHSHVIVINLDVWGHFWIFWQESVHQFLSYLMSAACMTLSFQGVPEEPFEAVMMTIGWLFSCRWVGECNTGNVSLVEWPT